METLTRLAVIATFTLTSFGSHTCSLSAATHEVKFLPRFDDALDHGGQAVCGLADPDAKVFSLGVRRNNNRRVGGLWGYP